MQQLRLYNNYKAVPNILLQIQQYTSMKKYQKFIRRQRAAELELEDKKMPMIEIIKQTNTLRFIHPGEDNEVSAARTIDSLPTNSAAVYFQAYVRTLSSRCEGGIGIIQKDCALKRHPGMSNMSIGYLSTGDIYINGKKAKKTLPFKSGSTVGVGVVYSKKQVFFTLDGKLLQTLNFQYNQATWSKFFPCLSLRHQGDQIQLRYKNFLFGFKEFLHKIEEECVEEVEKQQIDTYNIYSLVGDYLKFHGYKQTFQKLKQNVVFNELKCFVEHPFWEQKIKLAQNEKMDIQNVENGQNIDRKNYFEQQAEQQLVINRKCSTRQRIMSDYWGQVVPNQVPRKRVYENQRELLESRRKSSVISNMQIQQPQKKNGKKPQQRQQGQINPDELVETQTQKQKFLSTRRIEALKLIRQQKIQEALQILKENIPQIFDVLDYLQAYFHMHIYIRTLKNSGATNAMLYMRTQAQKFKKFKQQLYPVYCSAANKLKFAPFSQMMGLIGLKPGTTSDVLTIQQFYAFSNYVNELILKNMGLYPESRLDTFINHLKCVQNKGQTHQINGISIVCDI